MADPKIPLPALLVVAAFSRHDDALAWARDPLAHDYGAIALSSAPYSFHHTTYYEPAMGPRLQKQLVAFQQLMAPDQLAGIKLQTNRLESELAESGTYAE